jgi:hypothetical protein
LDLEWWFPVTTVGWTVAVGGNCAAEADDEPPLWVEVGDEARIRGPAGW